MRSVPRALAAWAVLGLLGVVAPAAPATAAPPPKPAAPGQSGNQVRPAGLPRGWQQSADRAVTVSGDKDGLHVLAAEESSGYRWRTVATLAEAGFDTTQWIGDACVTGSGRRAVVVYAPREFTNNDRASPRAAHVPVIEAEALAGVASALGATNPAVARSSAERAAPLAQQAGAAVVAVEATVALAEVLRGQGDLAEAARAAAAARAEAGEQGNPLLELRALITLGHAQGSREAWQRAETIARRLGVPEAAVLAELLAS